MKLDARIFPVQNVSPVIKAEFTNILPGKDAIFTLLETMKMF